jgi:crossover junction endodeoxyribonuclease RuvC
VNPISVVGWDLSLRSTGVTRYDEGQSLPFSWGTVTSAVETVGTRNTLAQQNARLHDMRDRVIARTWHSGTGQEPDLIVVEDALAGIGSGVLWVAAFWDRCVSAALDLGIPVLVVAPSQVKIYATGSGSGRGATKVTKKMIVDAVRGRYGEQAELIRSNDIADALILAAIGARMLGRPIEADMPAVNLRALDKLRLPEGITQ